MSHHAPGFGHCSCCKQRRALWRVGERWLCKRCKANGCTCDLKAAATKLRGGR